jgi:hypothetical protein
MFKLAFAVVALFAVVFGTCAARGETLDPTTTLQPARTQG